MEKVYNLFYHDAQRIKDTTTGYNTGIHTLGQPGYIHIPYRVHGCHGNPSALKLSLSKLLLPPEVQATMENLGVLVIAVHYI